MTKDVTIIDHGTGNLFSVARAVELSGGVPTISSDPTKIRHAKRLILPGVGAFAKGMHNLISRGLDTIIKEKSADGTPTLAICLGMQLLFDESNEFGSHKGLGILPGKVMSLKLKADGPHLRVPQVGWNSLIPSDGASWQDTLLKDAVVGDDMYFVHSYCVFPSEKSNTLAITRAGGVDITAVVRRGNITGCQFHPEKSGNLGLQIIRNFVNTGL